MICSYCGTENQGSIVNCSFCNVELKQLRPKLKELVYLGLSERPYQELSLFHTYDLLVLLRLVREERTKSYNLMRTLQKAPEDVFIDSDTLTFAENEYRLYSARMRLIEGILIDRMGYKPKRIDNKLLESLYIKIQKERV